MHLAILENLVENVHAMRKIIYHFLQASVSVLKSCMSHFLRWSLFHCSRPRKVWWCYQEGSCISFNKCHERCSISRTEQPRRRRMVGGKMWWDKPKEPNNPCVCWTQLPSPQAVTIFYRECCKYRCKIISRYPEVLESCPPQTFQWKSFSSVMYHLGYLLHFSVSGSVLWNALGIHMAHFSHLFKHLLDYAAQLDFVF